MSLGKSKASQIKIKRVHCRQVDCVRIIEKIPVPDAVGRICADSLFLQPGSGAICVSGCVCNVAGTGARAEPRARGQGGRVPAASPGEDAAALLRPLRGDRSLRSAFCQRKASCQTPAWRRQGPVLLGQGAERQARYLVHKRNLCGFSPQYFYLHPQSPLFPLRQTTSPFKVSANTCVRPLVLVGPTALFLTSPIFCASNCTAHRDAARPRWAPVTVRRVLLAPQRGVGRAGLAGSPSRQRCSGNAVPAGTEGASRPPQPGCVPGSCRSAASPLPRAGRQGIAEPLGALRGGNQSASWRLITLQ